MEIPFLRPFRYLTILKVRTIKDDEKLLGMLSKKALYKPNEIVSTLQNT